MTEQDRRHGPAQLAISPPARYARAGAHVDRDPAPTAAADPARARIGAGRSGSPPPAALAEPTGPLATAPDGQPRRGNGRFAHYPLRRRAQRMRDLGHADHAAAKTPRDQLAAALDYARRVAVVADEAGMRDPAFTAAVLTAIRDLMSAGDTGTTAMRTWRPTP